MNNKHLIYDIGFNRKSAISMPEFFKLKVNSSTNLEYNGFHIFPGFASGTKQNNLRTNFEKMHMEISQNFWNTLYEHWILTITSESNQKKDVAQVARDI